MTKSLLIFTLTAGFTFLSSSANAAVTIVSVSGVEDAFYPIGSSGANGAIAAFQWTQTQGYSNVTISVPLFNSSAATVQTSAYVTTSVGPGTTIANQIASTIVSTPVGLNTVILFTGLTLPPGTYFLVLYGDPTTAITGGWVSQNPGDPPATFTTDTGVTTPSFGLFHSGPIAAYPPATAINSPTAPAPPFIKVAGDPINTPFITESFGAASFPLFGTTSLTFTVMNPNAVANLTGVAFNDSLPDGLIVASPNGLTGDCGGGTITAASRFATVSLTGATLGPGASCTFSVNVLGAATGTQTNVVTVTSTNGGTGNTFSASVRVIISAPPATVTCPTVTSAEVGVPLFSPAIDVGGGAPPFTFSVVGKLPVGLTLDTSTGAITGTPAFAGSFTIVVTDSTGTALADTCSFLVNLTITSKASFLVRYAANLHMGESYIHITNTGANGAALHGPGFGTPVGNICVNMYAFDASEELIACCACLVTPDQTVNLGVNRDLTGLTLTGTLPNSVTIKLLPSLAGGDGSGGNCANSAAAVSTSALSGALAAWGTTVHSLSAPGSFATTETAFTPATLSTGELASLGGRCAAILGNGSGFGVCSSCQANLIPSIK